MKPLYDDPTDKEGMYSCKVVREWEVGLFVLLRSAVTACEFYETEGRYSYKAVTEWGEGVGNEWVGCLRVFC